MIQAAILPRRDFVILLPMRSTHSRAAVLARARGPVTVESLHFGEPAAGEILLRMEACGLCHSDLFVAGLEKLPLAPLTLGHEGIGRVAAVGPGVAGWAPGDRAGITFLRSEERRVGEEG